MELAEASYHATKGFPRDELFGLTSQIRRAAVSIAANIAEGYGREQTRTYIHFLRIAQGSLKELETHFLLSQRIGFLTSEGVEPLLMHCQEIGKMLRALIRILQPTER